MRDALASVNGSSMTAPTDRMRLDQALVARGLYGTRARARDAILRGTVRVGDAVIEKPGHMTAATDPVTLEDPAQAYVSRGALKLIAALDAFGFDPSGKTCLDIGASTGGFTQVLLERGASQVIAIDTGHGQLHPSLAADPRVDNRENTNARDLSADDVAGRTIGAVVADVSFISLTLALPAALSVAAPGAFCALLVKPQFEAGRDAIGKGGILKDPEDGPRIAARLADWLNSLPGWRLTGLVASPIKGGDGNHEFLIGGAKE